MGIAVTEDHLELEKVVRSYLTEQKVREQARAQLDAAEDLVSPLWADLPELGWLGIHLAEEHGGSGYGLPELVVIVEQLGRFAAPSPFVPTVMASAVIGACGTQAQQAAFLPGLADGSTTAAVVVEGLTVADGVLSGKGIAFGPAGADVVVALVGDDVVVLPAERAGVELSVAANVDLTRRSARITCADVALGSDDVAAGTAQRALATIRTIAAAEAVGGALDCVDQAVSYAKVREQFGRTIGTFQAVKHHCSNMLVAAEVAIAVIWDAARASTEDTDVAEFAYLAAAGATLALPGYVKNAQTNIQVHGGIGFTWEHDAHLHLRRALVLQALFGSGVAEATLVGAEAGVRRASTIELPPEAEEIRTTVQSFVAGLAGLEGTELRTALVDAGYAMPHWPKPYGLAAGPVEQIVIEQEFAAAGIRRPEYSITGWVVLTMIQHGTQEQIERFVRPALLGEEVWCQLFSEPGAGSDAAAVKTRAVKVDGGWKINGQKVWTSGAHQSAYGVATVRTDPDAAKHEGITQVIIDMSAPGVEVRPLRQITGESEFNEVFFTDVFVSDDMVIGNVNEGWKVARATLGNERVGIGGGTAGSAGSLDMTVKLAQRYADGVPGSRARVGRFLAEEEALRLLNLRRVVRSVVGAAAGPEGNVTKLVLAEHLHERANLSSDLMGAEVALADGPAKLVGYLVLAARGMSIAGGTSEITRNQIAERILGLPRDPLIV